MSIKVMSLVWENFPRGGSDKLVMLAMADWCNDQGGSLHPSIATVAKKINLTEKQARVIVHRLIAEGWLSVIGNENGGNPGQSRQYQVNVKKLSTNPADVALTEEQKRRQKVLERTNGTCAYCQTELGDNWHIDHVIPRSRGGKDCLSNLVPSCGKCNAEKGNMLLEEWKQTPPVEVTPPAEVTPPVEVRDPSRGGSFTPPAHGSLTISEPSRTTSNKSAPATRLPKDWFPSADDIAFCRTTRPDLNVNVIADGFRDYWIAVAGAKGRKLDWPATWRNWVRNQKQQHGRYESEKDRSRREFAEAIFGKGKNEQPNERDITDIAERVD